MNTYAVALVNHIDDEDLQLKVVTASNWWDALQSAFPEYLENLMCMDAAGTMEEAKTAAFNQDWEFDILRVVE